MYFIFYAIIITLITFQHLHIDVNIDLILNLGTIESADFFLKTIFSFKQFYLFGLVNF